MTVAWAYLMGVFFIVAGSLHFIIPSPYIKMIPDMLPYPKRLVFISGAAEILCGIGLLFNETRVIAAWATIVLLIAIFPANIKMAMHPRKFGISPWLLYLRLPLQGLLIWFAFLFTK